MGKSTKTKATLQSLIKYNNGLNVLNQAGVSMKDVKLSYKLSIFKSETEKLIKAFQDAMKESKTDDKEKEKEIEELLKQEYELEVPRLSLAALEKSDKDIPLVAFDYLHEFIDE